MPAISSPESQLEGELLGKLRELKYEHRTDIRDRASLEKNFREKFQALNQVKLTDGEFYRVLDEIVTPDVFTAAHTLRNRNAFTRDDGTPLNYTSVNIADWCKNTFEVISQLRISTDCSHRRFDGRLPANCVRVPPVEVKALDTNGRQAIRQVVVNSKTDPGNGYTRTPPIRPDLRFAIHTFVAAGRLDSMGLEPV
jgi:type I restriction enzyme R subunit